MKLAFATDDKVHISAHLGRAAWYEVVTIENNQVVGRETRPKSPVHHHEHEHEHDHEHDHEHGHHHGRQHIEHHLLEPIPDCQIVVARGMGEPGYQAIRASGREAICTPLHTIDEAIQAYLNHNLVHHPERVHQRH